MRTSLVAAVAVAAALAFGTTAMTSFEASAAGDAAKACAKIKDKAEKAECMKKAKEKK